MLEKISRYLDLLLSIKNIFQRESLIFICSFFFLLIITWITIEPAPLFFEAHNILPNASFASGSLQNPISSIFSLEGITTFYEPTAYYGSLYYFFYKFYSIIGGGIKGRLSLISVSILAFTLILLYQWFKKTNNHLFGIAAMIFFTFTIPVWSLTLAVFASPGMTMNLLTGLALYTYYFYYRKKNAGIKITLFSLLLVFFFTRASSLVKGEGRLVFPIILFFLIIESAQVLKTRKKISFSDYFHQLPIFQQKNVCLLLLLFLICIPVFTLFKNSDNIDNADKTPFKISILNKYLPGLKTFTPITGEGFFHTNYAFYYQLLTKMMVVLRGFGFHTLLLLGLLLALVYFSKNNRGENEESNEMNGVSELRKLLLFSFIWFLIVFIGVLSQRGLQYIYVPQYVYHSWLYVDYYYVIFPLTVFLFTLAKLAYDSLLNYKKYFSYLIVVFLVIHTITVFQWGGEYLDYLAGIDGAAKFVSVTNSSASLIVIHQGTLTYEAQTNPSYNFSFVNYTFYVPNDCSFFRNNTLFFPALKHFAPSKIINQTFSGKNSIFIISNEPLKTGCSSIKFFMKRPPESDTQYYKIKNFFKLSKETYVYRFVSNGNS